MAKIPLGPVPTRAPQTSPTSPRALRPLSSSERPVPAIAISPEELLELGLVDAPHKSLSTHPLNPGDKVTNFVARVAPAARLAAEQLEVPVEAVISQWALESGWGTSELASKHNNLGGIKAYGGWTGPQVTLPTFEKDRTQRIPQPFRAYPTLDDYASDYASFLLKPRYQHVRGTNNVRDFALQLGKAGYHQDNPESYANQLESISHRIRNLLKKF